MTKKYDDHIASLDLQIQSMEAELSSLKTNRNAVIRARIKALASGKTTTGDHIRDLVIRVYREPQPALEERLRVVEAKLADKAGELVLFTFVRPTLSMSRRGGPGPRQTYDEYTDTWFLACGMLTSDKLRIDAETIGLPIDKFATSLYQTSYRTETRFTLQTNPFSSKRTISEKPLTYTLDAYATPEVDPYNRLWLIVGDSEVRAFFNQHVDDKEKSHLQKCCELLGKLILEPTDE